MFEPFLEILNGKHEIQQLTDTHNTVVEKGSQAARDAENHTKNAIILRRHRDGLTEATLAIASELKALRATLIANNITAHIARLEERTR